MFNTVRVYTPGSLTFGVRVLAPERILPVWVVQVKVGELPKPLLEPFNVAEVKMQVSNCGGAMAAVGG